MNASGDADLSTRPVNHTHKVAMPVFPADVNGSITDAIEASIREAVPDADVSAEGGGGHYVIEVVSSVFEGKSRVGRQRIVLSAIKHLMAGMHAPVHAVDTIRTQTP